MCCCRVVKTAESRADYGYANRAGAKLGLQIGVYLSGPAVGKLLFSPYDVVLDPYTLMQPDILVIAPVGADEVRGEVAPPAPYLAIEVLAPSTVRADRLRKRPRYQRAGIECWLLDLDSQLVERWTPGDDRPQICADVVTWQPAGASESFELDVVALLRAVLGTGDEGGTGHYRPVVNALCLVFRRASARRKAGAP